jgi:putative copper resistance protein D
MSPDPKTVVLLVGWQVGWVPLMAMVAQVLVLASYVRGVRRSAACGRGWPPLRLVSFVAGLLVVAYAVEGGIAHYERSNFTAHVVQILLLTDIGPALLAVGAPARLALRSSPPRTATLLTRVLRSRPASALTRPATALVLATGWAYAYFLAPLYPLSERHPVLLACCHLQFFAVGCLFWWVVVGVDAMPGPAGRGARFVLVFASVPFNAALGMVVASVAKPLYPAGNTLADTRGGGNVLLGLAEVFAIAVLALLFVQWAREEELKAVRSDRQLDAALAVARTSAAVARSQGSDVSR